MKTFFYLLQKCIKSERCIYPDDPFEIYYRSYINKDYHDVYLYIIMIINEIHYSSEKLQNIYVKNAHSKLYTLNKYINNIYISNELKEKILTIFSKAQRCYTAFSKLANVYRRKKWPIVVATDLSLNPLDIKHNSTFVMLQNKSRYLFSMNDLINIIETAICNAPNFFSDPLSPKNPYNNQKLSTSILCNIYFKMKTSNCKFSLIIHLFFLDCFIKQNFLINNQAFLREYSIKKYVYTTPSKTLYYPILSMLKSNCYTKKLIIHSDFPKDVFVNIFRPYLFYYYIINYNVKGIEKNNNYKNELFEKLKKFYKYNELFGRKIYKAGRIKYFKKKLSFEFNSKHINFYNIPINTKDHNMKIFNINYDQDELFNINFDRLHLSNEYNIEYNIEYESDIDIGSDEDLYHGLGI